MAQLEKALAFNLSLIPPGPHRGWRGPIPRSPESQPLLLSTTLLTTLAATSSPYITLTSKVIDATQVITGTLRFMLLSNCIQCLD